MAVLRFVPSEACVSRVTDRTIQSALEVELNAKQLVLQGCTETPRTVSCARLARGMCFWDGCLMQFYRYVLVFEARGGIDSGRTGVNHAC